MRDIFLAGIESLRFDEARFAISVVVIERGREGEKEWNAKSGGVVFRQW